MNHIQNNGDNMLKTGIITVFVFVTLTSICASDKNKEESVIKVIEGAYVKGVFTVGDPVAMEEGFHEGFSLKGIRDGELSELAIAKWIEIIKKKKADGQFPPKLKYKFEYPLVEITGTTAMVKIEIFKDDKQIYTDYILLLKFSNGWKITDKIYFRH